MGIEEVKNQLIKEAEEKAQALLKEAELEVGKALSEVTTQLKQHREELSSKNLKLVESMKKKELAQAEFEGKKSLLDKKKEMIEQVLDVARNKLSSMSGGEKKKLNEKLLKEASSEIKVKTIYTAKGDSFKKKGIKSVEADIVGGVIAETEDGKVSVDLSFETLLDQIREEHLQEISEVLFGE